MVNIFIAAIVMAILGGAAVYIIRSKKSGVRCIGCPSSKTCSGNCAGCSCHCGAEK